MRGGSCWRLMAVAMISSKAAAHAVQLQRAHQVED
jgi:hypothetical protein